MTLLRQLKGRTGESRAARHLQSQGLTLLTRNYRCRAGELDLVMRDGQSLVFVEVRLRSNARFGSGADSVTRTKRRRVAAAAAHYLQRHGVDVPCRFDVVSIDGRGQMDWIRDAFGVDD